MVTYFVFFLLISFLCNVNQILSVNLDEYLDNKSKLLQEQLGRRKRFFNKRDSSNTVIENVEENIFKTHGYINMFKYLNKTFILTKEDLFEIPSSTKFKPVPQNNVFEKISESEKITFSKDITFNNIGFIIVKSEMLGEAYIYVSNRSNKFALIQTLFIPDAVDAHFFINNRNLYLMVANNKGDNLAVTSIYKWLGFHFDEIQTVFTTGAIKVGSFTTRTTEIIIILQDLSNRTLPSFVYQFSNEEIIKVQSLNTINPVHLDICSTANEIYIIIYSRSKNNTVYRWNEFDSQSISKFYTENVVYRTEVFKVNKTYLITIPTNENIQVFSLNFGKIELEVKRQYISNFSDILDIHKGISDNIYVVGMNNKSDIKINSMHVFPINLQSQKIETAKYEMEDIRTCFKNLELLVDTGDDILQQNLVGNVDNIQGESLTQETDLDAAIKQLQIRLNYTTLLADPDNLIIDDDLTVRDEFFVKKIEAKNIILNSLNVEKWIPDRWLKYEEPQFVRGVAKFKTLVTDHLETDNLLFKDVLLKHGNQVFTEPLLIENLTTNAMYVQNINNVTMEDVYFKNRPVEIKGVKVFNMLNVEEAKAKSLNEESPDIILSAILNSTDSLSPMDFNASKIEIENLFVDTINNVSWDEFTNSVFKVNETTEITGSLNFIALKTDRINSLQLKDVDIDSLFTTSTDQNISANVEINRVFVENVTAASINNINFVEKNLLLINNTELITDRINFVNVTVRHDLNVTGNLSNPLFMKKGDHVYGTKESDIFQTYTGKVVINNDLYLKDLNIVNRTRLVVSDTEVNHDLTRGYWSKNTEQEIPVLVKFAKGLSVQHLTAETLNDVKIQKFFLNNNETKMKTDFDFENVTVLGNVLLQNNTKNTPNLTKIFEESVKKNASHLIRGKKVFVNTLNVENLQVAELEGINVSKTLTKKFPKTITGIKTIEHLIVENKAESDFEVKNTINDVPIDSVRNKLIFIDQPNNISLLNFHHVNVANLYVSKINGRSLEDYVSLNRALDNITVLQNLTIKGNVSIGCLLNMSSLNDIPYEELSKNAIPIGQYGIKKDVTFTNEITVKNLVTSYINDINLKELMKRILTRNTNQNITAAYNFTHIKTENLLTPQINNFSVQNMIDTHSTLPQKIILPNGAVFSNVALKSLRAVNFKPCSMEAIENELADPPTQEWNEVEVKGNVFLLDDKSLLYKIFEHSVRKSTRNIIHSPVNFSASVSIKNLNTAKTINGISMSELIEDAVLSESDQPQIISGTKWFLTLHIRDALILSNLDAYVLNGEVISDINNIIVDKNIQSQIIKGQKTFFAGLQTDRFNTDHISNMSPENLVNLEKLKTVPVAIFESLEVNNNLNINFYDKLNFSDVIINRLKTDGDYQVASGIYYFENIEVQDLITSSINDINISDVVFDVGTQDIFGSKHFFKPVKIVGNTSINLINGINLADRFNRAILLEGPSNITGSVIIMKPAHGNGTIETDSINGQSVSTIKKILTSNDKHIETEEIFNMKKELIQKVKSSLRMVEKLPGEFMYLEKSTNLQISVPNLVRASSVTTKKNILVHVNGHEPGTYCGLPNNCTCPLQYTIEISPHLSVNVFPNKGFQRIFSYDDNKCIINFLTNSVSTSSTCSTNTSKLMNEVSMLTWTTKTTDNNPGVFYQFDKYITGYISKVDFFTLNEKSYILIGRYYDPVRNNYNLDCTVIRLDENRITATDIQRIPTKGVQEVYVFHTAQGVVLILGNKIPSDIYHEQENTKIYRFNPESEQFTELKTILSYGCSIATGIVVGADSLIALAHNEAPVQVLKYHFEFDNYYFYQSFALEDQVIAMSSFYTGDFGISEAYLCIVTLNEHYYIYSYQFLEGFKLKSNGDVDGLRNLIPMQINSQLYLFAPSVKNSSLLSVVKSGSS